MLTILVGLLFSHCVALSIINASRFHKTDITMLGDTYSVGFLDIRMNDTLHIWQPQGSAINFQNRTCRPNTEACPPCDWTDPRVCDGTLRPANSSCPCAPAKIMCFPARYAFGYNLWPKDQTAYLLEYSSGSADIAFHPPEPADNCSCLVVKYDIIDGPFAGLIMHYGELWTGTGGQSVLTRYGLTMVCPNDPRWLQSFVLSFVTYNKGGFSVYTRVNVSYEYVPIPNQVHSTACSVPAEYTSTHQCVPTGVYTVLAPQSGTRYIRAIIQPPVDQRCGVLGLWTNYDEFILSTDPWVSPTNSSGAFFSHRVGPLDERMYASMYPYCLQDNQALYLYMLAPKPLAVLADTTYEWMRLTPVTEIGKADYYRHVLGAVTAYCPGKNFTAHKIAYASSETMDTGSVNLRLIYPSDDYDLFNPPPLAAGDEYYLVQHMDNAPVDPTRIVVTLILEQRLRARLQPWNLPGIQNSYQWLTVDEWQQCTFSLGGPLADSNGNVLALTVTKPQDVNLECAPEIYMDLSRQVDKLQAEAVTLAQLPETTQVAIYDIWVRQDRILTSNGFYACRRVMDEYYVPRPIFTKTTLTKECLAEFNTSEFTTDPCCVLNETSLYDECKVESRSLQQYAIAEYTDSINTCPTRQCAQTSLLDLTLSVNIQADPDKCTSSVDLPNDQLVYWQCIDQIYGPEALAFPGAPCTHDSDCPGLCDVYSHRCLVDIAQSEVELVRCVYRNLTRFGKVFIANELGIDPNDPEGETKWLQAFYEPLTCSHSNIPTGFGVSLTVFGRCQGCNGFINGDLNYVASWTFSPGPSWAVGGRDCWGCQSSTCSGTQLSMPASVHCLMVGCTSKPYSSRVSYPFTVLPSLCSNATFCGISDDGFFYTDVGSQVSSCGTDVCILANGTILQVSPTECQSIFSCTQPGFTAETCSTAGACSDASDYNIGIWTKAYASYTAGCFFTVRYKSPFNPTATVCNAPFRSTILGCSVYTITETDCLSGNFSWGDPEVSELVNPRWIAKAQTETECSAYGQVCNDKTNPLSGVVPSYANTYSFREDCPNTQPLYTWQSARWLPGQPRVTTSVSGVVKPRFDPTSRVGVNFQRIFANITKATNKLASLKAQSTMACYSTYKRSLDQLVCSCLGGYNESFCYQAKSNITGVGVVCDDPAIIIAGEMTLTVDKASLPPATCSNLFFTTRSIAEFESSTITPLRTLIVNYGEDTSFAIRNSKLGIYGKVLTDGYAVSFTTRIVNVSICIQLSTLRNDYRLDKYPVLDLAKRYDTDLQPLEVNVIMANDTLCANLSELEPDTAYYFIHRVQDYLDVNRTVFTDGERVFLAVLLFLYSLGLIGALYRFGISAYSIARNRCAAEVTVWWFLGVTFLMVCFFAFRVCLFALLLSNGLLGPGSARAVTYLLFEFPILLYFAFVSNYISIHLTVAMYGDAITENMDGFNRTLRLTKTAAVVFNLIVFVLFVVMIILFETIILQPYLACGGTGYIFDSDRAYALLLVYRCIFSGIAIVLGFLLFISTSWLTYFLVSDKDMSKMFTPVDKIRTAFLSIVGGFGLVAQAVYFLIITAQNATPINYVSLSLLLALEALPALAFVIAEPLKRAKRTPRKSTRGTASGGKSGSGVSGGSVIITPRPSVS